MDRPPPVGHDERVDGSSALHGVRRHSWRRRPAAGRPCEPRSPTPGDDRRRGFPQRLEGDERITALHEPTRIAMTSECARHDEAPAMPRPEDFAATINEVLRLGWSGHFSAARSVLTTLTRLARTTTGERALCRAVLALVSVALDDVPAARRSRARRSTTRLGRWPFRPPNCAGCGSRAPSPPTRAPWSATPCADGAPRKPASCTATLRAAGSLRPRELGMARCAARGPALCEVRGYRSPALCRAAPDRSARLRGEIAILSSGGGRRGIRIRGPRQPAARTPCAPPCATPTPNLAAADARTR